MNVEHVDYCAIGYSLAGLSAALTLAKIGGRVLLLDFHRDTDALSELSLIQPTSLGPSATGMAFDAAMQSLLVREGVERVAGCVIQSVDLDGDVIVDCGDRRWSCKGLVFAPNGTEPGIEIEGSSTLQGFGVSYSAAADAPFYGSQRVAVFGDVPRVVEHASIAARYASEVIVLIKDGSIENPEHLEGDRLSSRVTLEHDVVLRLLQSGDHGVLTGIEFNAASGRRSIDVAALFVAQHVVPMTDVIRGERPGNRIAFAGLAAGVNYWEHAELVNDGARAADTLAKCQSR